MWPLPVTFAIELDCGMDLESISKGYFGTLNVLAEKITADIQSTQEAYQDLWHTLNKKEQNQAIDESIINPSAVLKYASSSIRPLKQNYNAYSWFCKSQLNLEKCDQFDSFAYVNSNTNSFCRSDADQSSKLTSMVKNDQGCNLSDHSCSKNKVINSWKNTEDKAFTKSQKSSVLKPKNPPPPPPVPPAVVLDDENTSGENGNKSNDIPKTGFDFLDNW